MTLDDDQRALAVRALAYSLALADMLPANCLRPPFRSDLADLVEDLAKPNDKHEAMVTAARRQLTKLGLQERLARSLD